MAMPSEKMTWPDERDGLISWLRGEFAAANAIIDSLCHHLRETADPGEYDAVIGAIQQRRCNWNSVLHMQHYFSVADVSNAVHQATWRRQQRRLGRAQPRLQNPAVKAKRFGPGTELKSGGNSGGSFGNGGPARGGARQKAESLTEAKLPGVAGDFVTKNREDPSLKISGNSEVVSDLSEPEVWVNDESTSSSNENGSNSTADQEKNPNLAIVPKTFVGNEMFEGKLVNAVEGLKLYEDFYSDAELLKLFEVVKDLKSAGKKGHLQGQTFIASRRPTKGHGREMIQFGLPILEWPFEDDISSERRVEAIPPMFQDVIECLLSRKITDVKPDSCIIDFYNEGDFSQPHVWPLWFGKPICVLFLTECDMTFGRTVIADHPGDFNGALRLSLKPGSLLALQGRSADSSKYAISSVRRQRAFVILTKSQPQKSIAIDGPRLSSPSWGPPPSRPLNHIRPPIVLPPNGIQPLLLTSPVPGTGVFLPPATSEATTSPEKENSSRKMHDVIPIGGGSPKGKTVDVKAEKKKEEQDQSSDN